MKIADLELFLVELPGPRGEVPLRSLLARLATDSGYEGWGESAPLWRTDELPQRREALLGVLAGRNVFDLVEIAQLDALAEPALRCLIEMACLDAMGRIAGVPLCRLLGGLFRQRLPLVVRLPQLEPQGVGAVARDLATRGLPAQIVVSSGLDSMDLRAVAAAREAIGPSAELRFDGRGRYDPSSAAALAEDLALSGVAMFVDPLAEPTAEALAQLARGVQVPLAVSRTIRSPQDVLALASGRAPQAVVEPLRVGGLLAARDCAVVALAARISMSLAGAGRLGVYTAALAHLSAAVPYLSGALQSNVHHLSEDVLCEPLTMIGGLLEVPLAPGLGVEVDRAKLERHAL